MEDSEPLLPGKQVKAPKQQISWGIKFLVAFLYFIQGIFLNVPGTIVLTYKQMPSYGILSYFSIAVLPFSLKFISAPLIEKYSSLTYGRRKTWVVISLIGASLLLFLISPWSMLEQEQKQIELALLFTLVVFLISLEDISVDALAVKELKSAELASFLQCIMQPIGGVAGSLLLLELVSHHFSAYFGYTEPFLTVQQFLNIVAATTLVSALLIHFLYQQRVTKAQEDGVPHSLWEVIQHYKHFFQPKYRMCRQGLVTLLTFHGFVYFSASYTVELIKNHNFSKQVLTSLSNLALIPIFIMTHFMEKYWTGIDQIHRRTRIILALRLITMFLIFTFNVTDQTLACACLLFLTLLSNAQFFLNSLINNSLSESKFSGMYITMMASLSNFANNSTIQLEVIENFGYEKACLFGFSYSLIVILLYGWAEKWIKNGKQDEDMESQHTKNK